jgi:hypothetical protein
MKKRDAFLLGVLCVVVVAIIVLSLTDKDGNSKLSQLFSKQTASVAQSVSSPFLYSFSVNGRLSEAGADAESTSPYWWLNSGAYMYLVDGVGTTVQNDLSLKDKWRLLYNKENAVDTDAGLHPQNIFRLITRQVWQANVREETDFNFIKYNVSLSTERDVWNGALHFLRYQDQDNLYYAGMRVDGHVVIKAKKNGNYYTMAEAPFWTGTAYDRNTNPVPLIPMNKWIAMRSEIRTNQNGSVTISLFVDDGKTGKWKTALTATDNGTSYGGAPILSGGFGGFRTDFYDIKFDNFRLVNL